jgi:hypothetical protein
LLIPIVVGFLSAGQQLFNVQGSDFLTILRTGWGFVYWSSRALLPMAGYLIWYFQQDTPHHSIAAAVTAGLGSELLVRAKFYIGQAKDANGKPVDVLKGVFDLIEWWQRFALDKANIALADVKIKWLNVHVKEVDFEGFYQRVCANAASLPADQQAPLLALAAKNYAAFRQDGGTALTAEAQLQHSRALVFGLLTLVGRRGVIMLMRQP